MIKIWYLKLTRYSVLTETDGVNKVELGWAETLMGSVYCWGGIYYEEEEPKRIHMREPELR